MSSLLVFKNIKSFDDGKIEIIFKIKTDHFDEVHDSDSLRLTSFKLHFESLLFVLDEKKRITSTNPSSVSGSGTNIFEN